MVNNISLHHNDVAYNLLSTRTTRELRQLTREKIDMNIEKIQLIPVSLDEHPILQNLGRFYVYDMTEYMGWEVPNDGLFECIDFLKYWQTPDAFPFLIRYENEWAGFVIVDKKGSDTTINYNMAQFFILRKFKHKGVGCYVASQCFDQFNGTWEVMVLPGNKGAYQFWHSVISQYSHHHYTEYTRQIAHFKNNTYNIFKFMSRTSY